MHRSRQNRRVVQLQRMDLHWSAFGRGIRSNHDFKAETYNSYIEGSIADGRVLIRTAATTGRGLLLPTHPSLARYFGYVVVGVRPHRTLLVPTRERATLSELVWAPLGCLGLPFLLVFFPDPYSVFGAAPCGVRSCRCGRADHLNRIVLYGQRNHPARGYL